MSAMPSIDVIAIIVFWGLMLPIAGYIFQTVCGMCGADLPSFRRSILITGLVGAAAFFTFDGLSYGIIMASRDTINLNLPPSYSYGNWVRESLQLKWQVLGLIPIIRYLPILIAVCLAATIYVFVLAEPFRNCIAILAIQWTMNVVAMAILSFALTNIFRVVGPSLSPDEPAAEQGQAASQVPIEKKSAMRPRTRRGKRDLQKEAAERKTEAEGESAAPSPDLQSALAAHEVSAESSASKMRAQLRDLDDRLAPYLEPIRTASAPYTQHLPPAVQDFLDDGGWWLVLLALLVAVGFWLRAFWRRLRRAMSGKSRHRRKRRSGDKDSPLVIDLDLVGDAFTDPGPQQITVRGQPGRLRLVILAPSPSYVGDMLPEMSESLLEWLHAGLGEILDSDKPRQVAWPRHPSLDRFSERFRQLVQIPEAKGRRTPWVLISGSARLGRQTVFVGLAVFLDKTGYQREIQVSREKWNEVLDVQKVAQEV
jgi:hypothetical protein